MNLIPVNRAMDVVLGDIQALPSASAWMRLVLDGSSQISISQPDMSAAFYLFRLPSSWCKYLCFNYKIRRSDLGLSVGAGESDFVFPACRVLPMGWSSSVGLMQQASRELVKRARPNLGHELRGNSLVPDWFIRAPKNFRTSESWWQVYLDNFMAAEVGTASTMRGQDMDLHRLAVSACAEDKHVRGASQAVELGVLIDGRRNLMGASGSRLARTVLASLALIRRRQGTVKQVQIILGRWIFILQFRRAAMSALSRSWDFITSAQRWQHWPRV